MKVLCINSKGTEVITPLKEGQIYTVRRLCLCPKKERFYLLRGIVNPKNLDGEEIGYHVSRFVLLDSVPSNSDFLFKSQAV